MWGRWGVLIILEICGCTRESAGPVLFVRRMAPASLAVNEERAEARASRLVVVSLLPEARAVFAGRLEAVATRLEMLLHPLGVDLDARDPWIHIQHTLSRYLPVITAARWMAAERWILGDSGAAVRLAGSCAEPHDPDEACVPLDDPRARIGTGAFALWPLTRALRIRVAPADQDEVVARLRARVLVEGGTIALVLTARDLAASQTAMHDIGRQARRIARALARAGIPQLGFLGAWGGDVPAGSLRPGLRLGPNEVLVVPRMGALARTSAMRREVSSVLMAPLHGSLPPRTSSTRRPGPAWSSRTGASVETRPTWSSAPAGRSVRWR
jgi:hypothetical protein